MELTSSDMALLSECAQTIRAASIRYAEMHSEEAKCQMRAALEQYELEGLTERAARVRTAIGAIDDSMDRG